MKVKFSIGVGTSLLMIAIGLLIVYITLYNKPQDPGDNYLIFSFFELLGFTIFTSGIFTILFQLPDWRKYFEQRLKGIILEQDYLNSLDSSSLSDLQVKTLKAYFKTSEIDKEGSFLKYFQDNLNQYISKPFREEVKTEINVLKVESDGYLISDRIMYRCRMVNEKIQENIRWRPDKDEFIEIKNLEMNIIREGSQEKEAVLKLVNQNGKYLIDGTQVITLDDIYKKGLVFDLKDFQQDRLFVEVKSVYKISRESFCNWSMAHPTKSFYITIRYPENCTIRFQPLLLHPEKMVTNNDNGLFTMEYNEWLLPMSGVVYSFIEKESK